MIAMCHIEVLLVEDSPTDVEITRRALDRAGAPVRLHVVRDGEEALDFLYHRGRHADAPRPQLILLDLNLPKIHGHEVLRTVKQDPALKVIPVIVFSASEADEDVEKTYRLGVNSYFSKPTEFLAYRRLLHDVERYWTELAKLPA
ncbi:MAG TPA: response regulator [Candidatus Brocadiia bacterium]|mgnify:CR=1 FL=1|nr:response regulator [Candidatus Brocadiia bacterium]